MFSTLVRVMRQFFLPILLLLFCGLSPLSAKEEFWKDFFYLIDGNSYDKAPLFYHPLTEREAQSIGSYTVVYLDEKGILKEALTFQSKEPLYYSFYLYDEFSHPMARISYYFKDANRAEKNNLVYFYYCGNRLCASSYFEYSLLMPGEKIRTFTKIYEENREAYGIDEYHLHLETELSSVMEETELRIDEAMKGFQGGDLFLRKLVK